jgi:hypothetical protein
MDGPDRYSEAVEHAPPYVRKEILREILDAGAGLKLRQPACRFPLWVPLAISPSPHWIVARVHHEESAAPNRRGASSTTGPKKCNDQPAAAAA